MTGNRKDSVMTSFADICTGVSLNIFTISTVAVDITRVVWTGDVIVGH